MPDTRSSSPIRFHPFFLPSQAGTCAFHGFTEGEKAMIMLAIQKGTLNAGHIANTGLVKKGSEGIMPSV